MSSRQTPYQTQYFAWLLSRQIGRDSPDLLASTLVDARVDLNPHQVEAALFAFRSPLSQGVILADEVGLGKTIEAGLVIAQRWAERKRRILIIAPANLRKQWHQELQDKFSLQALILEAKSYKEQRKEGQNNPFDQVRVLICSYQFAKTKADDLRRVPWDLVVMDEAHRLRNVYKPSNVIGKALKDALAHAPKVLLTATPLQNTLLELYGLVSLVDERVFGDLASFRDQFGALNNPDTVAKLRNRLQNVCMRTLRRQVQPYISYTKRIPMVEAFTPSQEEQALRDMVADYLRRPALNALPAGQRQLISLVLWKLLASSSYAIGGALGTMAQRLQDQLGDEPADKADGQLSDELDKDYESLDETEEEWSESDGEAPSSPKASVADEIAELREFQRMATTIRDNAKGQALLTALGKAFAELERLHAPRKALIFTESRRTQDYLLGLLEQSAYAGQTVLFNGTNSSEQATRIYQDWLKRHAGTDRITGSRTADTRAALVEHFKESASIMIATEAGAEGINLQFCSLVINYDLPWNPQRIEQRIGRCHRYGQKHDVVVVNFVDHSNPADKRVYELLAQKFQLFEGVFGASDEVLGTIGSGVDFERRIAEIYQTCRNPQEIEASFQQLQLDLSGEISAAMLKTRQLLLENFDEAVQDKLKLRQTESTSARNRFERLLMDLTQAELQGHAEFDHEGFTLRQTPHGLPPTDAPPGRYELPRRSEDAHLYRTGHPLAQALIQQARQRTLPTARVQFSYDEYGTMLATLLPLRGQTGWLSLSVLSIDALGVREDYLLLAAITDAGQPLHEEDVHKLLRLPAQVQEAGLFMEPPAALAEDVERLEREQVQSVNTRNLGYFDAEVQKLDAWADDLKVGLENEVKELDREIKDVRRTASVAATLEEKLHWQKRQRELEDKRNQLRRRIFDRQDEIDAQRSRLIDQLEDRLASSTTLKEIFQIQWELI
ncbi:SNF2-related protein [Acidovorax sp. SUPP950]|uniref:SNF2-related protein n=1 Tax=Acidovorax sp. SUPP950 TaxID=511901 RepID=UPI0024E187A4|nr:SNF2-related protein [Acidovorax sp. SUPP950]